jgi:hypothetical protein
MSDAKTKTHNRTEVCLISADEMELASQKSARQQNRLTRQSHGNEQFHLSVWFACTSAVGTHSFTVAPSTKQHTTRHEPVSLTPGTSIAWASLT